MLGKLRKISVLLREMGIIKTYKAVYNSIHIIFRKKVLRKDFVIKRIHNYKMWLPISNEAIKGIAPALIAYGVREEDQLLVIKNELRQGMRVLDIGANIGYYSLLLESIVGSSGKVYSIEPSSENFKLLKTNIALNNKEDVIEAIHAGVSDNIGSNTLHLSEHSNSHSFFDNTRHPRKTSDNSGFDTEEVNMISIDSFTEDKGPIHFVRMDVEGFEVKVFCGMNSFIENSNHEIKILFEVHRSRYDDNEFNMRKELTRLFDAGFIPKTLIAKPLLKSKPWGLHPFSERGYSPKFTIRTDGFKRGFYSNISNNDVLDYVCSIGCVRALLLCRKSKDK